MVKKKACIFISGSGTNLKALIKNSREYNFPIDISYVISSTNKAKGLDFAKIHKIPYHVINFNHRLEFEFALRELKKKKIFLICLAGYMKVIRKDFISRFKYKIINIHPSILPKYKGLNTYARVLKSKDQFTGCTVHHVNSKLDSGKIIIQKKILIKSNDTKMTLRNRVQKKEYKAYAEAIFKII